jgi:hypothetical protein
MASVTKQDLLVIEPSLFVANGADVHPLAIQSTWESEIGKKRTARKEKNDPTHHVRPCFAMVSLSEFAIITVAGLEVLGKSTLDRRGRHFGCE